MDQLILLPLTQFSPTGHKGSVEQIPDMKGLKLAKTCGAKSTLPMGCMSEQGPSMNAGQGKGIL
jgi:hypothetical protein